MLGKRKNGHELVTSTKIQEEGWGGEFDIYPWNYDQEMLKIFR